MSFNSEPTVDSVVKFAKRMEKTWANQQKQDEIFLALEQMRNRPDVAQMKGSTTPVKLLHSGTYGVLVDEEGALLTVTPFGHFNPPTDSEDDAKQASEVLEPWLAAAMKLSQKNGKVFVRKPRAMRSMGRAWSFCSHDPSVWGTDEYKGLLSDLEAAKGAEEEKAAQRKVDAYKRDHWPFTWRYVDNAWAEFSGRHWLPEVIEIHKLSKEEVADLYPDLDLTAYSGSTTELKVYEYANHEWCMTVVGENKPTQAYKWRHGLGMNPYCLMESELMPPNDQGIRWKPAGYYAQDLIETLDEILSDLRHNHRQNTLTPLLQVYDKDLYEEDPKRPGRPPVETWEPGGTYAIWKGSEPILGPVPQINQQSIFLVNMMRDQIRESFIRPVQRGESKSGDAANLIRTQSQMADREFDPAMQAIKDAWEYIGKIHLRGVVALNREYPGRPDKVFAYTSFNGKGAIGVGPDDVLGWENALQARAERAVPIDRNAQTAVAQNLLNMNVDPKTVFEGELGYEDSESIIRQANRYRLRQALFDQVVIPAAIQRSTAVLTTATPQQQQQIQEMFTGASPALQQVLSANGAAPPNVPQGVIGPQGMVPGEPTLPAPGNVLQAASNEARTGVPQAPQNMPYGGG